MFCELTDGIGVDDLVLRVDVDLAALVLSRLDGQQEQVQLSVTNLRHLKLNPECLKDVIPLTNAYVRTCLNCSPTKVGESVSASMTLLQAVK